MTFVCRRAIISTAYEGGNAMAYKKMVLFNVLKLTTSYILQQNNHISLDYDEACKRGLVISLGDNQLFNFVRRLTNNVDLVKEIDKLEKSIKTIRKDESTQKNIKKLESLQEELDLKRYCPEIISVKCDSAKKDYKSVCKTHFVVDIKIHGVSYKREYRRLCAGAGQLRRNSAIFCSVDLYDQLNEIMMCGLTKKTIGSMNLAKFSAYFALYTSSSRQVTTPRICVIPDYEYTLKNQLVDWIYDRADGEKDVEERYIDFEINAFDGSGMISPRMMKQWSKDLGLDYSPTSFIVRAPWVKGLVTVFDFHKFAKEVANKDFVVDLWGKQWPIDEIDVILTKSQMKLSKKYESWEQYLEFYNKYGHIFSVTRVNKKKDNLLTPLNYQYVQTNNFSVDDIKQLADYSLNWVKKLMSRDYLYTLLFLSPNNSLDELVKSTPTVVEDKIALAMMYNPEIVNDDYVNRRVVRQIQNKIDKMKIGKIFVEGAYEFIIPDLYAMAEHAFGLDVHGLLPPNSLWNRRWVEKGSTKVTAHRSPLVAPSENRILDVYSDDKCMEWYQYIHSGNMMNVWDMTVIAMSDADKMLSEDMVTYLWNVVNL